jgi:hypothetical protein
MNFSPNDHTLFFDGYLDAIGRLFTTDEVLVAPAARVIKDDETIESILECEIQEAQVIENITGTFEKEISKFLDHDPRQRILFYLIEYFAWYSEFSHSCKCKKYTLKGNDLPKEYLAYVITCNDNIDVLIYIYKKQKNA